MKKKKKEVKLPSSFSLPRNFPYHHHKKNIQKKKMKENENEK